MTVSLSEKRRDHLSIQISPCRLTMQAKRYRSSLCSLVEIVHSQSTKIRVIGLEGVAWQTNESLVRSSKRLHVSSLSSCADAEQASFMIPYSCNITGQLTRHAKLGRRSASGACHLCNFSTPMSAMIVRFFAVIKRLLGIE